MYTRLFVFFWAFALFACSESADPDPSDPETEIEADFTGLSAIPGSGRRSAFSFAIGNKVYVGAGFGRDASGQTFLVDFWEYDLASNTWTEKGSVSLVSIQANRYHQNPANIKGLQNSQGRSKGEIVDINAKS